jgi:hypothetical protein
MLTRFRPRYANVTSTLALFVALSGGAYAAASLPARSVGPAQLKKDAVVRAKIKSNAVNGSKVAGNSLSGADIDESTLAKVPAAALADGAGHANSAAALDKITYKSATGSAPAGSVGSATAGCDAGQHVVGGGLRVDDPVNGNILDDNPDSGNTAWTGRAYNTGSADVGFTVFAICATATATG